MRCGFLSTGPMVSCPVIFAEFFPSKRTASVSSRNITVTNRSNFSDIHFCLFFCLHFMCVLAPEPTANSLSSSFIVEGAGKLHSLVGEKKVGSFVRLWENIILGQCPRVSAGASLLSFSLLLRLTLKFHSVGTALMRKFDLYFSRRWTCFLGCWHDATSRL